ncbi:MAG: hypothetical protein PUC23_04510 [bacterium]|nr:hypothetical protein [bacterium]
MKKQKKRVFINKKIPILIVLATLFMGIGYASVNSVILNINGNATAYKYDGLFISSITTDEENTLNGINTSNVVNNTMLNTSITLGNDLSSKFTMIVNVCNNYSDDRIFSGLRYMDLTEDELAEYPDFSGLYTNNDIVIDDSSYSSLAGTILSSNSCMNIPVTFKYASSLSSITNNELVATINFKFDSFENYKSNISYAINSTSGTFENKMSNLNYDITVTNNNTYAIKFNTYGSSNENILLSGTGSDITVDANSFTTTTITLSPAKEMYENIDIVSIDINVQVIDPIELPTNSYTINISTFGSPLKDIILGKTILVTTQPSFSQNVTTLENSGLFKTLDESGDTYYYRGVVTDNYISFANKMWRLVRINGDGTYRLVLDSSAGTSVFSSDTTSTYNLGYMYGSTVHDNTNSSAIKTYLENWYINNLQAYDNYIDKDAIFWQDRNYNSTTKVYAGWVRMVSNSPTLVATTKEDMFSVTTTKGNGKLTKPIGLLTADEVVLAGGTTTGATTTGYGTAYKNTEFYLYTGDYPTYGFWTMTPRRVGSGATNNHMILSKEVAVIWSEPVVTTQRYVRPVINLKANTLFKGSGTKTNPYVVTN